MTFLNPLILFGLLSLPIPFIIHLWHKRRMKRIEFPSITLLKRAETGEKAFRRLKDIILLILRTLCLLFIVFGFANLSVLKRQQIVILDNSYDMLTKADSRTLFEIGENIAKRLKAKGCKVILASGDSYPYKCRYQKFSIHTQEVDYVITKAGKLPHITGIEIIELNGKDENFSVDSLSYTPPSLLAFISNHTKNERDRIVNLSLNAQTFETRVSIPPYSTATAVFPLHKPVSECSVWIENDALKIDNIRYFVHPQLPKLKVLVVANYEEAFFIKNALAPNVGPTVEVAQKEVEDRRISVKVSPKIRSPENYNMIVFIGTHPLYICRGLINQTPTIFCPASAPKVEGFLTLDWISERHPIFSGFKFIPELKQIKFTAREIIKKEGNVIASFSDGTPAIIEPKPGMLRLAFPLNNSAGEFVLSPLFVPVMHQIAYYVAGKPIEACNFEVGELVKFKVDKFKSYKCVGPILSQELTPEIEPSGMYVYFTPEAPGIYEITGVNERYDLKFAVNISDSIIHKEIKIDKKKEWMSLKKWVFTFALLLLIAELVIRRL
ncbi:MAG: BatA domain-containing protein [bacterium]|nr:BatA domain-containing protein [bacterium]